MRHLFVLCLAITAFAPRASVADGCPQFSPGGQPPTLINPKLTPRTTLLCNDGYAVIASGVTHGALWSAEHPTATSLAAAEQTRRQGRFHAEGRLPSDDQAQLADYRSSGFDRGHMTPSGDMPDKHAQQQTFSLANMVPQTPALNRGPWEGVESAMRHLAEQDGELYLVTGPAFRGTDLRSIGPDGVLVPSSTWKAVYDPRRHGTGVYVCKNTDQPTCVIVSVATLIHAVGIDPFPAVPDRVKQVVMVLPPPEDSPYAPAHRGHRRHRPERLLDRLLGQ